MVTIHNEGQCSKSDERRRTVERHMAIWLNESYEKHDLDPILTIVNCVQSFSDCDQCINYIGKLIYEKVFIIILSAQTQHIVSILGPLVQVDSIYILSTNDETLISDYRKIKGNFRDIPSIITQLKMDVKKSDMCSIDFSVRSLTSVNLNTSSDNKYRDISFIFGQFLKNIFIEIGFSEGEKLEFIQFCRQTYSHNPRIIDQFEQDYIDTESIPWYTKSSFLYYMINHALRTLDIEMVCKLRFIIRDISQQIKKLHREYIYFSRPQTLTTYRGQGMSRQDFQAKLRDNENGLLFINTFWSTSYSSEVATMFLTMDEDIERILFKIHIDIQETRSVFADISSTSVMRNEEEVLFPIGTIFQICDIEKCSDNQLWIVTLKLTSETDKKLEQLRKHMIEMFNGRTGWEKFALLISEMGEYKKAIEVYQKILADAIANNDAFDIIRYHSELGSMFWRIGEQKLAMNHTHCSMQMKRARYSENHPQLISDYSTMGGIMFNQGYLDSALDYFKRVLNIRLQQVESDYQPLKIALAYNNIAAVLRRQEKYSEALTIYQHALELYLKHNPVDADHDLAAIYINLGVVYLAQQDYKSALFNFEMALTVQQRSLLSTHPSIDITHQYITNVLNYLGQHEDNTQHTQETQQTTQYHEESSSGVKSLIVRDHCLSIGPCE